MHSSQLHVRTLACTWSACEYGWVRTVCAAFRNTMPYRSPTRMGGTFPSRRTQSVGTSALQFNRTLSPATSHLVTTPARVMTTSSSSSPPPPRPDHITIRQPDPNKQQLPQLTDKESGPIAHGRGHPIKQPGVTVGGVIRLALPGPPSLALFLFLHRAALASACFH